MLVIVNENDREMTYSSTGFNIYIEGRKKYFGRLDHALNRFGWLQAAEFLHGEDEIALKSELKEIYPPKVRVKWSVDGVAGPYECETYPHHRGVTLNLTSFTDSHLAKSPTTSSTVFPATHAQAGMQMVVMDVQSKAFQDGPFNSEKELLDFMKSRFTIIKEAARKFQSVDVVEVDNDDDSDDSEEAA